MSRKANLDKFHDVLFKDFDEQQHLTLVEREQLKRYRAAYAQSLENPSITDTKLRDYLMNEYGISQTQAYYDIANIRILLGNVRNAGKEWVRYLVNETLKEAIEACRTKKKRKSERCTKSTKAKLTLKILAMRS